MILTLKDKVWWFALYSRIFVLITSAVFNFLLPDHAADAFVAPKSITDMQETYGDVVVKYLCGGLRRWDAQYYMHIAMYGYTYENCLAFFPLFPILCRIMAQVLYVIIGGAFSDFSLYEISSLCINVFCFVKSASILYDLSLRVLKNESLAYKASIFYCINPASIFFSAPYSETLYACLTFYGMLKCGCGFKDKFSVSSGILFGLSAITRSNGLLNIGFVAYKCANSYVHQTLSKFTTERSNLKLGIVRMMPVLLVMSCIVSLPYLLSVVLSILPFITFQMYGYHKYCIPHNHSLPDFLVTFAQTNNLVLPGIGIKSNSEQKHWCEMSIPFSYSYIQSYYWNVGFLRYYHWKEIPNFILAVPVVWIISSESYLFIIKHWKYCLHLGLYDSNKGQPKKSSFKNGSNCGVTTELREDIFPYLIHALVLTLFCVLCAHVQITTRMISSCSPLLYWFCAKISSAESMSNVKGETSKLSVDLIKLGRRKAETKRVHAQNRVESEKNMNSYWKVFILDGIPSAYKTKFIHLYFMLFAIVGTILFSNFLPWT